MGKPETYRIADLASQDRPRERLRKLGPESLSTAELLAVLLHTGVRGESAIQVGQRLLQKFGGLVGIQRAHFDEVEKEHGLGEAKASTLKAAIELGNRLLRESSGERPRISSPEDVASLLKYEMSALDQEHLRVVLLNTRNEVLSIETIFQGSVNSSPARIAEIFKPAIRTNALSIILVHNHPSGDPTPSPEDIALTKAVREAGNLLDIEVLDHLIIGQGKHISMKERHLGF